MYFQMESALLQDGFRQLASLRLMEADGRSVRFNTDEGLLEVSFYAPGVVRLRWFEKPFQLRSEVGKDAARFFYVLRRSEQHMDFDLRLATSRTNENSVFYVQYAHARICSVFRQLDEKGLDRNLRLGMDSVGLLTEEHELNLVNKLARYPETLERAALQHEPHQLILYLRELANDFHAYYNAHKVLVDEVPLRNARLNFIAAVRQVLANGLGLLNINTPERGPLAAIHGPSLAISVAIISRPPGTSRKPTGKRTS